MSTTSSRAIATSVARTISSAPRLHGLYRVAAIAALLQLACTLTTMLVVTFVGPEPATAQEYYTQLQQARLSTLLRMDFPSMLNVALFVVTGIAIFAALRQHSPIYAALGTGMAFIGVAIASATHPGYSIIALSEQFAQASSLVEREQLLAAGQVVIATGWWLSTAGLLAGLFLQGGFVLLHWQMRGNSSFSRVTIYSGLLANGLDAVHIIVGLFAPTLGIILLATGGICYLLWFPALARDLLRLARTDPAVTA